MLFEKVKKLEEENALLKEKNETLEKMVEGTVEFMNGITPIQVYKCKARGNTTVKFLDGTSVKVHKMKGDKDSLETAIVYALFKKIYTKELLKHLVDTAVKVRIKKCKKD